MYQITVINYTIANSWKEKTAKIYLSIKTESQDQSRLTPMNS